jgi:hypothetical protein
VNDEGVITLEESDLTRLLEPVGAIQFLDQETAPLPVRDYLLRMERADVEQPYPEDAGSTSLTDSASMYALWDFPSPRSPWLLTAPNSRGECLLLMCLGDKGFETAYRLDGLYYRFVFLDGGEMGAKDYLLCWGDSQDLLCFEVDSCAFLWKKKVGDMGEWRPALADLEEDGNPEILIASSTGAIRILDLHDGEEKFHYSRVGTNFTRILQARDAHREGSRIVVGVQADGLLVLDPFFMPSTPFERQLDRAIDSLEQWLWASQGP